MQVLDFARGVGGVPLIVGRLVGGHGSVTGGDIDPEAMVATERASERITRCPDNGHDFLL
jgi:ubiquinone/menaquinone biosynthesis C-methylase UbiE